MNQMNKLRWALITASLLSGSAMAATINCAVTPKNSVVADGQTLQLAATCTGGSLSSIDLLMNGTSVSGSVTLSGHLTGEAVYFTSPVGLAASGAVFTVVGTPASLSDTFGSSTEAKVVVKSAAGSAAVATTGFASTSTPVNAACGTANNSTVALLPSNGALCASGSNPALVVSAPTSYSWACISLTGGAEANCYATRASASSYTVTASAGTGGTISPSGSQTVNLNETRQFTVSANSGYFINSVSGCNGSLSGSTYTTGPISGACSVTASFSQSAPTTYTVTASAGTGGSISPPSQQVTSGATAAFTVTASSGYAISGVSGCNGTLNGSTYTTGQISGACSVTASFTQTVGSGSGDTGVGSGLWAGPGMDNRTVADISGPEGYVVSYVPGCLNGQVANNSYSGCAANSSYSGTLAGTSTTRTVSFGSGKEVMLRYRPKANAGTSLKLIRLRSSTGSSSSLGVSNVRMWLSTDPAATYDNTPNACKQTSSSSPYIITGPGYCQISTSNPVYYLGIAYDSATVVRFQVDQSGADLY